MSNLPEVIARVRKFATEDDSRNMVMLASTRGREVLQADLTALLSALDKAVEVVRPLADQPKAIWKGDPDILPYGCEVTLLCIDPECPDGRGAAWVRCWESPRDAPMYRSCDLADLGGAFLKMLEGG